MDDKDKFIKMVLKTLRGSEDGASMKVKSLRKSILLSLQIDEDDKDGKKQFKKAIQSLESQEKISLNVDGLVSLSKKEMKKKKKKRKRDDDNDNDMKQKKEKKQSKKKKEDGNSDKPSEDESESLPQENQDEGEQEEEDLSQKNKPCKENPQGVTRLFLGNLPFSVDETSLSEFLLGGVTHIKWITDKETGRFYGSAFVEMKNSKCAASVVAIDGQALKNRPIKINYAPAREGDAWPPSKRVVTGGKISQSSKGAAAGGMGLQAMGEKPANCTKLFIGNLSYDIDDEGIYKFFGTVDAEVKAVRWLHHKDTGDFKGVGFVEFWNEEACNKGATLNGKNLLGRPIRIDWTD